MMGVKTCILTDTFDFRLPGLLIVSIFWVCQPAVTLAQSSEAFTIPKLNGPITLDGHVNEPAWEEIEPLPLISHWPSFGYDASEGTELRIAYDEEYLYVSCICYEEPGRISAPTYKRNYMEMNLDHVSVVLDTFNDNENALWFSVTPTGSRSDAAVRNDAEGDEPINMFWDAIWEAEAVVTDFGWTAEMRIPFSSLRFESKDDLTQMGLVAYRYSAHNVTMRTFPAMPTDWGFWSFLKPSQTRLVQFEGIENRNPIYFTPYLLGGGERVASLSSDAQQYQHDSDRTFEAGFDLKMGLTNNITLDLTANTDFAQVEADDEQINLTRFSLFFPERRQFFLERAAVFDFSFDEDNQLFYSRRIGLSDEGQPLRILGGARKITRAGGWDVGLLSMQTARDLGLPSENFSVGRFRKQLFNPQSYAGGMITSRFDEDGNYNLAYGLDGIFKFWNNEFLNINIAHTADNRGNASPFHYESVRLQTEWQRRSFFGLSYNLSYNYSGRTYNPGMGFQLRQDYMSFGDRISYGWQPGEESSIQRIQASMNGNLFLRNEDGSLETAEFGASVELTWRRGDFATAQFQFVTEDILQSFQLSDDVDIPVGRYRFREADITYHTPRGKGLRAVFNAAGGEFFDGNRFRASVQPEWSVSRVVQLELFYEFNRIRFGNRNQQLSAHIARFRNEFTFNTQFTLSSFIQYNSADDFSVINVRFRYNPRDGNDFYLVFNETLNSNRARLTPRLLVSDSRAVLVKFNYTFSL
jgi:hypothetical protein